MNALVGGTHNGEALVDAGVEAAKATSLIGDNTRHNIVE